MTEHRRHKSYRPLEVQARMPLIVLSTVPGGQVFWQYPFSRFEPAGQLSPPVPGPVGIAPNAPSDLPGLRPLSKAPPSAFITLKPPSPELSHSASSPPSRPHTPSHSA